jgi:rSAM/selenodomain-associated transferase 2
MLIPDPADTMIQQSKPRLSVIVPMLNEQAQLAELLAHLQDCKRNNCELILVDGGSTDQSVQQARALGFTVLESEKGRARQMNLGAQHAQADYLLFLHADTRLPEDTLGKLDMLLSAHLWGRFDVRISGDSAMFKVIAWFINQRSRLTGIATGDQAMFIRRDLFASMQGFPQQALMEDIELSKRLKKIARPACLREKVLTSGRRWQERGIWKTIFLMWRLRFAYWCGVNPDKLLQKYR